MPRLFTGVEIPDDVAFDLDLMRGGISGARWIDRESYHITLRFIGDIDEGLAREISYELEGVEARPFKLRLTGCGVFGGNKPHSLFVGVEESPELRRLQSIHERICQALGMPAEPRKFAPHVTLARLRDSSSRQVADYLSVREPYRSPAFTASRFVLYSSRASVGGAKKLSSPSYMV